MASVIDVAKYILQKVPGQITAMKLQKLVYYAQAWSVVWDEEPLFDEEIRAWANGPVVQELYNRHRGMFKVNPGIVQDGNIEALADNQKVAIDNVLDFYGDKTAQWLSDLTHMEDPWKITRKEAGLEDGDWGSPLITLASIEEYYSSL